MFARQKQTRSGQEPGSPALHVEPTLDEVMIVDAFESLVHSKLAANVALEGRIGEAWKRISRLVKEANNRHLGAIADLGYETGETAVNVGWVYHDFREVAQSTASISSAVEQMVASIADLSNRSAESASQAENARDTMRSCANDSRGATEAMMAIEHQSSQIGERLSTLQAAVDQIRDMAGVIDTIARQTNLLALNATIEAARAGEAGRGFAVVAAEVKSLSVETSKATQQIHGRVDALTCEMKEISSTVKDNLKSVDVGNNVVRQVGTIIEGVTEEVSEVAERIRGLTDLLQQQRAATSEVAHNVTVIADKANKTKDEVEAIDRRLQGCQDIAKRTLDAGAECATDTLGLVRFGADATAWRRSLAEILLGKVPAPETGPAFLPTGALAEAEERARNSSTDAGLVDDFRAAIKTAQENASLMVAEVRKSNWGAATGPYIACEQALQRSVLAAKRLVGQSASAV